MTNEEMKLQAVRDVTAAVRVVEDKMRVLSAMDADSSASGCNDLVDQFVTSNRVMEDLNEVVNRMVAVVPGVKT